MLTGKFCAATGVSKYKGINLVSIASLTLIEAPLGTPTEERPAVLFVLTLTVIVVLAFSFLGLRIGGGLLAGGCGLGAGWFTTGTGPRLTLTVMELPACTCWPGAGCCDPTLPAG